MTCCLNPDCQQPQNPDDAEFCLHCGAKLTPLLRNRYRVVRPIGQGGFGKTYLALDEDRLKSRCVIKQFSPQVQGGSKSIDKAVQLFEQEAVRLHELGEHPQIPTLLAYFEQEQRLYLVQQFIEGQTLLQELLYQGSFSEQRIREVLVGVLPVLKFVHDHQVIHRDITPSNVIRRKADNKLVLIDFGVAKLLSTATASLPGTKIGTEGYAPMEQIRSGRAFPASDIYSLGATCIFLMTQTKPDDLYDPLEGRWLWRDRLMQRGGKISESIAQILDKMLKDLVSERYQSADAVMRDLRQALSRPPATSNPSMFSGVTASPPTFHPPSSTYSSPPYSRPPAPPPSNPPIPTSGQGAAAPRVSGGAQVPHVGNSIPPSKPPIPTTQDRRCLHTLAGHSRWVMAVAISPNGQLVASGGLDDVIKLWNLTTGELITTLTGHTKAVNCLTFSPDSQFIISGSDDDTVRVWQTSGQSPRTLMGHTRDVNSVAIHTDGQWLVSGSEDRTIRLWKITTGETLRIFPNLAGMIRAVAISPDGQLVASGGLDNQIKLWNLRTGEQIHTFAGKHFNSVNAIVFSPNSKTLVSGSKDKTIKVWNLAKGEVIRTLSGHSDSVNSIALSSNGQRLVSGSSDKTIRVWDLPTGALRTTLHESHPINAVSISPDGGIIASGSSDNTVKLWQVQESR
ncbi:protein kinase domain-containing protein [Pantanalinema sp. GBBB05]|uniref:protein kinase domain-containing protein n=1 Tax=Pantanalinema sp. GBBB05 TaxID=2604139 RepID=UPI001D7B3F99|nr:protein kinase [Pantanalinema sp. GBBB05]